MKNFMSALRKLWLVLNDQIDKSIIVHLEDAII